MFVLGDYTLILVLQAFCCILQYISSFFAVLVLLLLYLQYCCICVFFNVLCSIYVVLVLVCGWLIIVLCCEPDYGCCPNNTTQNLHPCVLPV